MKINAERNKLPMITTSNRDKRNIHIHHYPTKQEVIFTMEESNTTEESQADIDDDKTVIVEGIGKATSVGELNMKMFITVAMGLPSFWK
ncbi:hypothetical protein BK126_15385 [Paenibacillus sp. FSL H7-0326]|uniref:hypothetical protein n=1 Tax=Paenibacillus sp. FSL H7-0326 TaxID=1921144 RepID=UPI00096D718C|nr:hypothetical protein [Paenibacillus sp. FSL H7-0326]OMC69147.1 hypothetical protein BK126_15385 [Paenibacillus sp. FSL H7-0326]